MTKKKAEEPESETSEPMKGGGGPPDKWTVFSTHGMTSTDQLAAALNQAFAEGYTTEVIVVPSPMDTGNWIALGGYAKSE